MIDIMRLPRLVRERWAVTKRDLGMVSLLLQGKHPPPLIPLVQSDTLRLAHTPRALRVREVIRETPDALTLVLTDPNGGSLRCEPGQFFTVLVPIAGKVERRAYSASSYVADGSVLTLTCKRMIGGRVSTYLHEYAHPGMMLQVLGPSGNFTVTPQSGNRRHLVLIGGGSGITPLHCIAQAVLAIEKESSITLLYGNRSRSDIIFAESLARLATEQPQRFTLRHVLVEPDANFPSGTGILDQSTIEQELAQLSRDSDTTHYYLCGPLGLMESARSVLLRQGVTPQRIHEERFATPQLSQTELPRTTQSVEIERHGVVHTVQVAPEETVLDAGLRHGIDLPFSCTMGGCGACKAKLVSGDVLLPEPNCLTAEERAQGHVLLCVSHPRRKSRVVVS